MKRLLILLAAGVSAPALAQHDGHVDHAHHAPPPAKPAPPAKPVADPHAGHAMPAKPADPHAGHAMPAKPADPHGGHAMPAKPADPHAGHAMPPKPAADPHADHARRAQPADPHAGHAMPARPADPHAGHAMPAQPADPHAGHAMPAQPADPHAGHAMPAQIPEDPHGGHAVPADPHSGHGATAPQPPVAPAPAEALSGPAHAADLFWDDAAMARSRREMHDEHGGMKTYKFLVDQLEAKLRGGRDGYAWDAQAWYGGDIDKLWLKSEGEGEFGGGVEAAEVQALWSRAIDPWFDLQLGVRYDLRPDPDRAYLVAGIQGLAPYWFEVDGALFLSEKGDLSARLEAEYDLRITQKLILQPRAEIDIALQSVPALGTGSGLTSGELGARLRYELSPQFAPYVGVEYERAFGGTARFRRAAGEEAGGFSLLLGVRTWF